MTTADNVRAAAARANDATYDNRTAYETAGLPDPAAAPRVGDEVRFPCGCRYHRTASDLAANRLTVDACPEHRALIGAVGGVTWPPLRRDDVEGPPPVPAAEWLPRTVVELDCGCTVTRLKADPGQVQLHACAAHLAPQVVDLDYRHGMVGLLTEWVTSEARAALVAAPRRRRDFGTITPSLLLHPRDAADLAAAVSADLAAAPRRRTPLEHPDVVRPPRLGTGGLADAAVGSTGG